MRTQLTSIVVSNGVNTPTLTSNIYDGKMRLRIRKEYAWASGWLQTAEVRYIYDGNVVIQERDGNNLPATTYTRGQELSGSLQKGWRNWRLAGAHGQPSINAYNSPAIDQLLPRRWQWQHHGAWWTPNNPLSPSMSTILLATFFRSPARRRRQHLSVFQQRVFSELRVDLLLYRF